MRAILTYHSIDSSGSSISVCEQDFRRHAAWLASGRVRVVRLETLLTTTDSRDMVAITFDDAFQNFRTVAAPILEKHGLPAMLFVATAHVGGTNAWSAPSGVGQIPVLPLLDWDGIAAVAERGVSIGSHCKTHQALSTLGLNYVRDELAGSANDLRRELGIAPTALAYPYGDAGDRERDEAARVYELAVGTDLRFLDSGDDQHLLPRIDAYYLRAFGRLESFGTTRFARFLRIRSRGRKLRASMQRLLRQGGG